MFVWRGLTLSQRIVGECRAVFDEIIIVRGQGQQPLEIEGVNEVRDIYPNSGPLCGIHAGLSAATRAVCFVVACDMPAFSAKLARRLLELADGHYRDFDIVAPHDGERLQPLCAVYKKSVLPICAKMLTSGERSVKRLYEQVRTKVVDCKERGRIFSNANYKSDLSEHF
ncbi:putative molybdenum cofactor guanylyltransferase [Synergistales bacterium]|nr:putative molybdenum cofactor guanylyltransferase [Synergistales bacterium]